MNRSNLVNGSFETSEGWTVEGDQQAAHFGPDPNRGYDNGLVLGYPYEETFKTGGKEATVAVKQTIAAPPVGRYKLQFMRYGRWTKGAVASQGYDLAMVRYGPYSEGLAGFSVRLNTLDSAGKVIQKYNVYSVGAWEEVPWGSWFGEFDVTPETASVQISIDMDKLSGCLGVSDMQILRWPEEHAMNTRWAVDGMPMENNPIAAFSPNFHLKYADHAITDPLQLVVPESTSLTGPFEGMVADTMVTGDTRLEPIMQALDRYGRPRGALGAIAYHGDNSNCYIRSAWAMWGVSNKDLFARGDDAMAGVFTSCIDRLVNRVFLNHNRTDLACYRYKKAPIQLDVNASNFGSADHQARVMVEVIDESGKTVFAGDKSAALPAGQSPDFAWMYNPDKDLPGGLYHTITTLELDGKPYDRIEGGFFVWDEKRVVDGPRVHFER